MDFDVVGEGWDDEYGYDYDLVEGDILGAAPSRMAAFMRGRQGGQMVRVPHHAGQRVMRVPPRPSWRQQMAPGVVAPNEGLIPLPLTAQQNGGVFDATTASITFQGQVQKPFRPERLLTSVVRTGTTATGRLLGQLFVGTDLQQADIDGFDVELYGAATAFGTRLTCKACTPGVFVRILVRITNVPTGNDTVLLTASFAGRVIH